MTIKLDSSENNTKPEKSFEKKTNHWLQQQQKSQFLNKSMLLTKKDDNHHNSMPNIWNSAKRSNSHEMTCFKTSTKHTFYCPNLIFDDFSVTTNYSDRVSTAAKHEKKK